MEITLEYVDRLRKDGLTRHTHSEIVAAIEEWDEAYAEHREVYLKAHALVAPHFYKGWSTPTTPEWAKKLRDLAYVDVPQVRFSKTKRSGEQFPITRWRREAARLRNVAGMICRLIAKEVCHKL